VHLQSTCTIPSLFTDTATLPQGYLCCFPCARTHRGLAVPPPFPRYDQPLSSFTALLFRGFLVNTSYSMSPSRLDFQTMMLNSPFGADGMRFRPKEFYGWAIPVVMNNTYNFFVNSTFEWTLGTFRLSEPTWVTPNEWLMLSTNFTSYRYQVRGCLPASCSRICFVGRFPVLIDITDNLFLCMLVVPISWYTPLSGCPLDCVLCVRPTSTGPSTTARWCLGCGVACPHLVTPLARVPWATWTLLTALATTPGHLSSTGEA
jgi:hypothetical protein